ncbi:MAG: TetR/AcrR family transcriptional regulator [Anaerolineae bacterium]|jgi:AcrR family transcriptional regulator|nr:TetR/AcrR family transcriptional regulator [Anaerolineae bacterium]MBT3711721.1 TetR/AcrR family transcriptional regulator [Anaerolineae bacterium]MBT4309830.1 TetR/AcrR family transcriptional regulator [Anaerolineae bacterium]MBT4460271.1 TetR/AcrR family transcriptional regulator [Anaerolineae bacterium]MBT6060057.1 TetR/AcrR family transcriptional regulator [Anaerolineae bacterium]
MTTLSDKTRSRILDAAADVFADKGYHDARMDEIVEASDTSKGAVYHHFPSKNYIFFALIDKFTKLLEERLREAIEKEEHGLQRVDAAIKICMQTFGQHRTLAKIALVQAVGLGETFETKRREINDRFAGIIQTYLEQAIADDSIPAIDTEVAARAWMGALNEVVLRWVYTGSPNPDRAAPALQTLLLRSIGVSEERIEELNKN